MSIQSKKSDDGKVITVTIDGRFDYSSHIEFRKVYSEIDAINIRFIMDFRETDYIDSSALGMLLLLREAAGGDASNIEIVHCKPEVFNILRISNFQNLFTLQ